MTFIASVDTQVHAAQQTALATPEGRHGFAVYIANVEIAGLIGLEDFVTGILKHLAGQHGEEERHARFEELKAAVRSGNPALIEGAVHRLMEAPATCREKASPGGENA